MNIRHLEEYLVLARYMNFTTAAKYLNLTQSALSKHIAALEKEFDCVFFSRDSQLIEITEQGKAFCVDAQHMINLYQSIKQHMKTTAQEVRLAGAVEDAATFKLIAAARTDLAKSDPDFALAIANSHTKSLLDLLLAKRIDLFIDVDVEGNNLDTACESCILATVPLVAIVSNEHVLANRKSLKAADLADHLILYPSGSLLLAHGAEAVDNFFRRHGVTARYSVFFVNALRDFAMVGIGQRILVTPRSNYSRQFFPNIVEEYRALPFQEADAVFPYRLVWRANEHRSNVLTFRDTLIAVSERLHPGNRTAL